MLHYDFMDDYNPEMRRIGNQRDLEMLEEVFSNFENSDLVFVKSAPADKIPEILSEPGIQKLFPHCMHLILM